MTNSTNTVYATKRLIGRMYDDGEVQKEAKVGCWGVVVVVCVCGGCDVGREGDHGASLAMSVRAKAQRCPSSASLLCCTRTSFSRRQAQSPQ